MAAREPKWMSLSLAEKFEPMAKALGVSEVARSKRGFFAQFKDVGGRYAQLDPWWRDRRNNFVKRHMAQVRARSEKLVDADGMPTRRHLALIMWAYSPFSPERLKKMLREYEQNGRIAVPCADVVAYHNKVDGTGDPEWLAYVADRICEFPDWELSEVPLDLLEYEVAQDVDGYAALARRLPLIVAPGTGGRFDVLDGRHRASAAADVGRDTVKAWRPAVRREYEPNEESGGSLRLYHGTAAGALRSICATGIRVGEGWGGAGTSGVFLSRSPVAALYWAKMAHQRDHDEKMEAERFDRAHKLDRDDLIVVVQVDVPFEELHRLKADDEQFEDVQYPEDVEQDPDDWESSLKYIGDARFDGPAPPEWVSGKLAPSAIE